MLDKILIFTMSLCIIVFSGCMPEDNPSPLERYDINVHNFLTGRWKLVGKSYKHYSKDGYVDITNSDKYVEFTKNGNSKYGNFLSNMYPMEAYYIPTSSIVFFYDSLKHLNKSSESDLFDYFLLIYCAPFSDTLELGQSYGWFNEGLPYIYYYFIKMEDE